MTKFIHTHSHIHKHQFDLNFGGSGDNSDGVLWLPKRSADAKRPFHFGRRIIQNNT